MSHVTDIILTASLLDEHQTEDVNAFFVEKRIRGLFRVDDYAGGKQGISRLQVAVVAATREIQISCRKCHQMVLVVELPAAAN